MEDFSVLIGGKAGFGIDKAGSILSYIVNRLGYNVYVHRDYPSLIRGGHTFSIIRAASGRISAHLDSVDYILALNQDTVALHKDRLKKNSIIIYDTDAVKCDALTCPAKNAVSVPIGNILKEEGAPEVARNTCAIGALAKTLGIDWAVVEGVLRKEIAKDIEINLKVAKRGYDSVSTVTCVKQLKNKTLPLATGNEAVALGLVRGGLKAYIAYPMTPTSPILHFLAANADDFNIEVLHPESEIAVMLMALGFSYCGEGVAVGTSGGGFCLMTEGLSFAGMAELPVVIVLGQRPGPSTGLPTYTAQTELNFALAAGQGEFVRFVVAPGDTEEAYLWSAVSMDISKKFRIPSIILTDKTLGESVYNMDIDSIKNLPDPVSAEWRGSKGVFKINSYEHDENGITTEDPVVTKKMQDSRLGKKAPLEKELKKYGAVNTYGNNKSSTVILCWGSNKGPCVEAAQRLGLKVVQPVVLSPFPADELKKAVGKAKKIIAVENNATGQLSGIAASHGVEASDKILKYDGRPFSVNELEKSLKKVI